MPRALKTYLGDGVYASFDGYQVWIWISNGETESDSIALEPAVLANLVAFDKACRLPAHGTQSR